MKLNLQVLLYILFANSIFSLSINYSKLYKYVKHNVIDTSDCEERKHTNHRDNIHESNPHESKPHESNPHESISHESNPHESISHNNKPHDNKPQESKLQESKPQESKPREITHDNKPHEITHIENNHSNNQRGQTSIATFYFRVGPDVDGCPAVQTFNDGNSYGPCRSEDGSSGVKYTSDSKYWAAIGNAASRCGEMITVNYNGRSMQLRVMDECPACHTDNHVDMSLDALIELTGSKEAACAINRPLPIITWH
jgi:hypothetical protein